MGTTWAIIHTFNHAEMALKAAEMTGVEIQLLTAEGAAGYGGPFYFMELIKQASNYQPTARYIILIDCGDNAAMTQFALDVGWRKIILRGSNRTRKKLIELSKNYGRVEILSEAPVAIDLALENDPMNKLLEMLRSNE